MTGPAGRPRRVGFVGLGQLGALMAGHLLDRGHRLSVFDVRPEAVQPLATRGAVPAGSVAEVAAAAEVVSVMVLDDAQTTAVVDELVGAAAPGTVLALHSTIHPDTAVAAARAAGAHGVDVLDAPVSGGPRGAQEGRLAVMVGGDPAVYERARDVFAAWAELVVHVGTVGAGTRTKLARNLLTFVSYAAAAEAQRLAEAAGIDLRELAAVVRHSDALTGGPGAIMLRRTTAPVAADDPMLPALAHTRTLAEKDLRLAVELGDALGVPLPLARLALASLGADLGVPDPHQEA